MHLSHTPTLGKHNKRIDNQPNTLRLRRSAMVERVTRMPGSRLTTVCPPSQEPTLSVLLPYSASFDVAVG